VAAIIRDALEFAGEVHGFFPVGDVFRRVLADVADAEELVFGRGKDFGRLPKNSSSDRARTGPTPSIMFNATSASRESMWFDSGSAARGQGCFLNGR